MRASARACTKIPKICLVKIRKKVKTRRNTQNKRRGPLRPALRSCNILRTPGKGIPMKIMRLSLSSASVLVLATGLSTVCLAQTAPTTYRVVVNHVRPDMLTEWLDLQKNEVVPALKKGGTKTRSVYSTFFGNAGEYVVITPFGKYADFDGPSPLVKALTQPGADRLQAKTRKCLVSSNSYEQTRLVDISNVLTTPPEVIVSVRYRIAAGKLPDFIALVKSD